MRYNHYIAFGGSDHFLLDIEQPELVTGRPNYEFYRTECDDLRILQKKNSSVYSTLNSYFGDNTKFDTEIAYEIYRGTRATGTNVYTGYFSVSDGQIEKDRGVFRVKPTANDSYRDFLDIGNVKYDVRDDGIFTEDIIPADYVTLGAWTDDIPGGAANPFDTLTGSGGSLTSVVDGNAGQEQGCYQSIGSVTDALKVIIEVTSFTVNGGTGPYFDVMSIAGASITDEGDQQITGVGTYEFTINLTATGYIVLHTTPATQVTDIAIEFYVAKEGTLYTNVGALYMDFIERFITNSNYMDLDYSGKIKSTFINNDALPSDAPSSIDTWMTSHGDGNYASENETANPMNTFIITETWRWVDGDSTEVKTSFLDLMRDLEAINLAWYIDADGDFRIEHIKYFEKLWENSTALDITGAAYPTQKRELNFDKSLLASREQFNWSQVGEVADSEDFIGKNIIYDDLETISTVKRYEFLNVTTDLDYLLDNADSASATGFTFLHCHVLDSGDYFVNFEEGVLSEGQILNGHFSWANLHDKYWTWRRMSENGDMNDGDTTTFDSAVKFLKQKNIKIPYESDLDGFKKITVTDGTGQQGKVTRDLNTDFLTIELMFDPYA